MKPEELPSINKDVNSPKFREQSVERVFIELTNRLSALRQILIDKDTDKFNSLSNFILTTSYDLAHCVLELDRNQETKSSPDTVIAYDNIPLVVWRRPEDLSSVVFENIADLDEALINGFMDLNRYAKGVYFLEILSHKFKDGNGRVARSLKLLLDKAMPKSDISVEDVKKVLGIKPDENNASVIHPDFLNIISEIVKFTVSMGLSESDIHDDLKLDKLAPEKSLDILSDRLNQDKETLRKKLIHYIVVESDLENCTF